MIANAIIRKLAKPYTKRTIANEGPQVGKAVWSNGLILFKTGAISSECTPETAQALVKALKEDGWPVSYGGRGNGSISPNTSGFSHAFYAALAEITRIP